MTRTLWNVNDDSMPGLALLDGAPPAAYRPLRDLPLIILVGVTGVGKSTTLGALRDLGVRLTALPNRREITDAVMIAPLAGREVRDREQRFALTARYRQTHPGGMAEALAQLAADSGRWPGPLLFDGLRGINEVAYAAQHLPRARFILLDAPDVVRVRRLLGRADAFDKVSAAPAGPALGLELRPLPGVTEVFSDADLARLAALPREGLDPADVLAKTKIVLTERRNYDPMATRSFLAQLPSQRALVLDTVAHPPPEVAARIREWL